MILNVPETLWFKTTVHRSKLVVIPAVVAVMLSGWTVLDFEVALSVPLGLNDSKCSGMWPPKADCVVDMLPMVLGFLMFLLAASIACFLLEKPTDTDLKNAKEQHERRHNLVEEMADELDQEEDLDSDELGQVRFRTLLTSLRELLELPDINTGILGKGIRSGWTLFEKELRIAIHKTREGKDIEYSSGEKLDDLLNRYEEFYTMSRRHKLSQEKESRLRVWNMVKEGYRVHRTVQYGGVIKALQMIWLVRNSLGWTVLESLVAVVSAMVSALGVYYTSEVLNTIQAGGEAFWLAVKAMVLVKLTASLLNIIKQTLKVRGRSMVSHEVKVKYFDAVVHRDISWWAIMAKEEQNPMWDLFQLDYEVDEFLQIPQEIFENFSTISTHAYLVLRKSSRSFYLLLLLNFGTPLLSWILHKVTTKLQPIIMRGLVEPSFWGSSWMHSIDPDYVAVYQSFARSSKESSKFREDSLSRIKYEKRTFLIEALENPIKSVLSASIDAAQIQTSGKLVTRGQASLPEAQAMMHSSGEVASTSEQTWSLVKKIVEKAQPLSKVYDLITMKLPIDPQMGFYPTHKAKGHIELRNVKFSYPSRSVPVLKDVSFEASPGMTIGLTGKAGCGKSTVMKLLERFYDVSEGSILLDGRDIREYNPEWLRRQIVAVSQEPVLIPSTIRDNIAFGCPWEPSLEEIYEACRVANIYDTLMDKTRFPQGLRTELDRVPNISGGEKQRIAIARAVLADSPILLLDEATASLDEENQKEVQDALNRLQKGRTTIVIAHRLSTIKHADVIFTFKQGRIAESGTHNDLLGREGSIYANLWNTQIGPVVDTPTSSDELAAKSNPQEMSSDDDTSEGSDEFP